MKLDLISNKALVVNGVNPNDEYYTPKYAIEPLLSYLKPKSHIWCPFDTEESNFVKILKQEGHDVVYSHIGNEQDFFKITPLTGTDYIISNPPYSKKNEVLERLFKLKIPFAMLMGVVGIFESQRRFDLFKGNKFEVMYFNRRVAYTKGDEGVKVSPPFSSVYICSDVLPQQIVFEEINKK